MNGSKFIGLGVAAVVLAVLVLLPALAVVDRSTSFANVYALIIGSDFSSDTMSVAVFLIWARDDEVTLFLTADGGRPLGAHRPGRCRRRAPTED